MSHENASDQAPFAAVKRESLAWALFSATDRTEEDRRTSAARWANLTAWNSETDAHVQADAALAWFAARQAARMPSEERVAEVLAAHTRTVRRDYQVTCTGCGALIGGGPDDDAACLRRHQAQVIAGLWREVTP